MHDNLNAVGDAYVPDRSLQIAWAAGLFEGEGSWRIRPKFGGTEATLSSTDRDVVEKFMHVVGFGSITIVQPLNPRAKVQHKWTISRRDQVQQLALCFLPHLGERRHRRALEILALPRARDDRKIKTHCPHGHRYDEENTYWYVKNGYASRHCRICRAVQNIPEAQRRRREARKLCAPREAHS